MKSASKKAANKKPVLNERIIRIMKADRVNRLVLEANELVTEALDKEQVSAAISAIKTLRKIDFGQLTTMATARTKVVEAAVKAIGEQKGLMDKIKGFFKRGGDNPIVDSLAFVSSATVFFGDLSGFIGAVGDDDDQTVMQAITPSGGTEASFIESQKKSKPAKDLYRIVAKGFEPEGELQVAGKGWVDRYLGGKKGMTQLATEILKMKVGDLKKLASNIEAALKPVAEQVNKIKVGEEGAASAESESSVSSTEKLEAAIVKAEPKIRAHHAKAVAGIINKMIAAGTLKPGL